MPKYVIEREIPGAGKLTAEELKVISQKSCGVLKQLGSEIPWLESYVTDDKIYASTSRPARILSASTRSREGFPPTAFRASGP